MRIFTYLNNLPIVDGEVDTTDIAGTLKSLDDVHASMGLSHDNARKWVLNVMEAYAPRVRERFQEVVWHSVWHNDVDTPAESERILQTALWVACRGENGKRLEEAIRHDDMAVECRFRRSGSQAGLKSIIRSGERATRVMQRWEVHGLGQCVPDATT